MLKKFLSTILLFLILSMPVAAISDQDQKPEITAAAYVLYNPQNKEVVDAKNQDKKMYPASLTKMLTALTVVNLCQDLDKEIVTVSENAVTSLYGTQSSTAKLLIGEKFSAKQLLYLMLMPSGNDAANALAEHFCQTNTAFAKEMNKVARQIGMKDSNFCNPHGLHQENHYTTAYDLALLSAAYLENELLYKIAKTIEYDVAKTNKQPERIIRTTNFMRIELSGYYYQYATGLKTGNTDDAGRCLAASAEKDGKSYICILLDVPEVWNRNGLVRTDFLEAAEYFEFAFRNYETVKIADKGQKITELPVFETFSKNVELVLAEDIYATLPKGTDLTQISFDFAPTQLIENQFAPSPIKKGDVLGNVNFLFQNKIIGQCSAVAKANVEPSGLIVFWHSIDFYVYIALIVMAFLVFILVILIVRKKIILYKRRKALEKRMQRRIKMQEEFEKKAPYDYFKMD